MYKKGRGQPKPSTRANIEDDPVLLFDNNPSGSHPDIDLLTIDETADLLKVSVSGVRRLQQGRRLPFLKVGGSIRFAKSDLVSYLQKQRVGPIEQ